MSERSGRWFSHQPNITGRGIVAGYTRRFWLIVVALGVTGAAGSALMEILKLVEHASWDYHSGRFLSCGEGDARLAACHDPGRRRSRREPRSAAWDRALREDSSHPRSPSGS